MASDGGSRFSYFLAGIGIGAILALLFAPRSGEETREFLRERTQDGRDYMKKQGRVLRNRAEEYAEKGKGVAGRQRESLEAALEAGKRAYQDEKRKM